VVFDSLSISMMACSLKGWVGIQWMVASYPKSHPNHLNKDPSQLVNWHAIQNYLEPSLEKNTLFKEMDKPSW